MVDWWPVPLFRPNKISSHARDLQMSTDPNTSWIIIFIVYNDYHSRHHHYYRHHHCCITDCLSLHIDLWSGWTKSHNFGPKIVWLLFGCLLVGSSHLLLILFFFVCSVVGCSVGGWFKFTRETLRGDFDTFSSPLDPRSLFLDTLDMFLFSQLHLDIRYPFNLKIKY